MIHVEDQGEAGRVRLVTIDRQEVRNALDHESLEALLAAIEGATVRATDGALTRVLVLAGAGHTAMMREFAQYDSRFQLKELKDVVQ
jgi:enoyl-CoA hydratase/carnithine racemase